jgi:hypothetical protein
VERARTVVTLRIRNAIRKIAAPHSGPERHLDNVSARPYAFVVQRQTPGGVAMVCSHIGANHQNTFEKGRNGLTILNSR